jgi:hypothetical protein
MTDETRLTPAVPLRSTTCLDGRLLMFAAFAFTGATAWVFFLLDARCCAASVCDGNAIATAATKATKPVVTNLLIDTTAILFANAASLC